MVHLPVVGMPLILLKGIMNRRHDLGSSAWKWNYSLLILAGVLTSVAYFTGPQTAEWTQSVVDAYAQELVENHALAGRVAFVIQIILTLLGVMGWASILQEEKPDKRLKLIIMLLLVLGSTAIIYTAHLGGLIRRPDLVL